MLIFYMINCFECAIIGLHWMGIWKKKETGSKHTANYKTVKYYIISRVLVMTDVALEASNIIFINIGYTYFKFSMIFSFKKSCK